MIDDGTDVAQVRGWKAREKRSSSVAEWKRRIELTYQQNTYTSKPPDGKYNEQNQLYVAREVRLELIL